MDGSAGATDDMPLSNGPLFRDALRFVIDQMEGGAKLIKDQGGYTKFGISQKAYPGVDIANLTRERAEGIYLQDYWKPIHGSALPAALALVLFDGAVNMGVSRAVKILQGLLHVTVDGTVGPETISAAKLYLPRHELVVRYLDKRWAFYEELARTQPDIHGPSLHGWHLRLWRLALEAGRWRGL